MLSITKLVGGHASIIISGLAFIFTIISAIFNWRHSSKLFKQKEFPDLSIKIILNPRLNSQQIYCNIINKSNVDPKEYNIKLILKYKNKSYLIYKEYKEFEKGKTNEIWHFDSKIKQCLFDKHPEEFIYSKANMYGDDEIFNLKKQGKFKFELFLYLKYIPPIFKGKTLKNRKHFTFVGENDGKMFKWIDIKPNTLIAHINRIINKFFKWVKKAG